MTTPRPAATCPDCQSTRFLVAWSKTQPDGSVIRIRECLDCGARWRLRAPAEIVEYRTSKKYAPE